MSVRCAIIDPKDGSVVNVIEYDAVPASPIPGLSPDLFAVESDRADLTWHWDGEALVSNTDASEYLPPPVEAVSPRQARLALLEAGLLDRVAAVIATASKADQISWEFATEIRRDDPLIATIGSALNLSSDQIDVIFKYAATQ